MKRKALRPIAVAIATLSTVTGMAVGAVSSQAAVLGSLTFNPASGNDANIMTVSTPAACNDGTTNFNLTVSGAGFPAGGTNVSANLAQKVLPVNAAGGFDATLQNNLQFYALQQSPPATLNGPYVVTFNCRNAFGAPVDTFSGTLTFANTGQPAGSIPYTTPVASVGTTTALASTPASPVNTGDSVAFTAHVSANSGSATPSGLVQLRDGATAIGSPAAVNATGDVTINTSFATAGSHSITAAFTGSGGFTDSVSTPPIVYTVNLSPATPTTTALAISPASADANTPVTLTATVAPTAAAGTVQFADGGTNIGSPVAVAGGTAKLTQTFAVGAHAFTAAFTPTNAAAFAASSTTGSQSITITAGASNAVSETIETTIAAGSLTISVPDTSKVILPPPVLNAAGTFLTTTGAIHPVTVTDTRAGNPGWTVTGQATDFFGTGSAFIAGSNLGWKPKVSATSVGQTVKPGALVLPETPPVLNNPAVDDTFGLHFGRTLATAAAGAGTGFAQLDADLALNVPTTIVAGTYDATLTLTAI